MVLVGQSPHMARHRFGGPVIMPWPPPGVASRPWARMVGRMHERELWELVEEVFGRVYGRSLSCDQQLTKLDGMTVVKALAAGVEPRVVWNVLCDQMDIPDSWRWGKGHKAPPLPAA